MTPPSSRKRTALVSPRTHTGIMNDSTVEVTLRYLKYFEEGIFTKKQSDFFLKIAHADFLGRTREYASGQDIDETFKMYAIPDVAQLIIRNIRCHFFFIDNFVLEKEHFRSSL